MISSLICIGTLCAQLGEIPNAEIRGQRLAMEQQTEISLSHECEQMNSNGQIKTLLDDLEKNAVQLANINFKKPGGQLKEVAELETKISQINGALKLILSQEWTESKYPYSASWNIQSENLAGLPKELNETFKFSEFEITSVKLSGIERSDLYPLFDVSFDKSKINILLNKTASTLELCQLQPTLVVTGFATFWYQNKKYVVHTTLQLKRGAFYKPHPLPQQPIEWPTPSTPTINIPEEIRCKLMKQCNDFPPIDFGPFPPIPVDPFLPGDLR
ncbi:hypothetical protein CIK05_08925 [Bdellovibrio sp. qaytius]|nr:hypothetical protein CIK05_08925 [Bdellovibrio sp. qaytius]